MSKVKISSMDKIENSDNYFVIYYVDKDVFTYSGTKEEINKELEKKGYVNDEQKNV